MPSYRLELEYDGSGFRGWQVQPEQRTVQGELIAALAHVCGTAPRVEGAGRTDAGVHALAQVATFTTDAVLEPRRLLHALAGLLPADMRVHRAGRVAPEFSARHSAESRAYRYQWLRGPSALLDRFHAELAPPFDVVAMQAAAAQLLGEHDFTAFAAAASGGGRCRVLAARIVDEGVRLAFEIEADRFLHNMVRRLSGALAEVGHGRETPAGLAAALRSTAPRGPSLPARGLFLVAVRYPPDAEYEATAVAAPPPVAPWGNP